MHNSWRPPSRSGKSQKAIEAYGAVVPRFLAWYTASGTPPALHRSTVSAFIESLFNGGEERTTAQTRQLAVGRFSSWPPTKGRSRPTNR